MTQMVVCREAGLALDRYAAIERGDVTPRADEVERVESVLPELPVEFFDVNLAELEERIQKLEAISGHRPEP
jgi:hypothetical protein